MIWDVLIIGAGVIGCAIARELARYELSIIVLEKHSDVSEGTTKANSAIVHAGYDAVPGTAKARLNVAGNSLFADWCRELGVPFKRNTSLVVTFSPDDRPKLQELLERGRQNKVPSLRIIDQAQLRAREPNIAPTACDALLAESGGICSPYELTIALAEQAVINGVKFCLNTKAECVSRHDGTFFTKAGQDIFESRLLINAAGVQADQINNQLSSEQFTITPRRGEYWMIDKAFGQAFTATIFQLPTSAGKGILVTPTVEGTVILGPTSEIIADCEDVRTTAAKLSEILQTAARTWPDIPDKSFITTFAGIRAHGNRGDFILGEPADVSGLINAAGIESPGLTAAPAIAAELSVLAAERLGARLKQTYLPALPAARRFRTMNLAERRAAIARDPAYGRIVCRCEQVSEAEIREAIRRPIGATTIDGIKRRTRAGMGRCQGGFCTPRVLAILSEESGVLPLEITKFGGLSRILTGQVGEACESWRGEEHD